MADFYGAQNGANWWKPEVKDAEAVKKIAEAAPTSENANQATAGKTKKVVQPFVVVPYVSQMQPLYQYDYSNKSQYPTLGYGNLGNFPTSDEQNVAPVDVEEDDFETIKKNKVHFGCILLSILSLLFIVVIATGKFVFMDYLACFDGKSGLDMLMNIPEMLSNNIEIYSAMTTFGLALTVLLALFIFIGGFVTIKKGSSVAMVVFCLLQIIFVAVAVLGYYLSEKSLSTIGYGVYALGALAIISFIVSICSHKSHRKVK